MRILLVGACSFPEYGGAPSRALHVQAKGLAAEGATVDVVTQSSTLGSTRAELDGFTLTSAVLYGGRSRSALDWARVNGEFGLVVSKALLTGRHDVVLVYGISPQFILVKALAATTGKTFGVIVGDTMERGDTRWLFRTTEQVLLRGAGLIVVNGSAALEQRIWDLRTGASVVRVWPPVDVDFFAAADRTGGRARFAPAAKNLIAYAGAVNSVEGIVDLLAALAILDRKFGVDCTLAVAGHQATRDPVSGGPFSLVEEARKKGVEARLIYLGLLTSCDVRDLYAAADVLVNPKVDHPVNRMAAPIKIGEYLASGTPVVTSRLPNLESWLRDGEEVFYYEPGDCQGLASAIARALNGKGQLGELTGRARNAAARVCGHRVWARAVLDAIRDQS